MGRLTPWQRVNEVHTLFDFAPNGVLSIKELAIIQTDKELARRTIGVLRPGHRTNAAQVWVLVELGRNVFAVAAHARTVRATALSHKAVNHAVEG